MQSHDRLSRTGTAVDDEGTTGTRADDGVLVSLDGAEDISHPGRPAAAEARDERGLVVERGVPLEPVLREHLVPVVADPAAGPAIPATAGQPHRIGVSRAEERLGRGGTPVEQQPATGAVREAKPSDVDGLRVVRTDHASEAHVQTEATQQAQASGQPVDLQVPLHRLLADAARRLALSIKAIGQVGDRLLEDLRDGREMLLVPGDQRRAGLGDQAVGKVKRAGSEGLQVISSNLRSLATVAPRRRAWAGVMNLSAVPADRGRAAAPAAAPPVRIVPATASACDYAARPGSCRKPPCAL